MNKEELLLDTINKNRLVHAVIVTGTGAEDLCTRAANALLCESEGKKPCLTCPGCRMYAAKSHPDLYRLEPEKGRKTIGVQQVRGLFEPLSAVPAMEGNRVVLVFDAERMTHATQSAFLKTLEEPPENTVFLLTGNENNLLPTVRSRCQILRLSPPEIPADAEMQKKAEKLISALSSKKMLDCNQFPVGKTERPKLDELLERMAQVCANRFKSEEKGEYSQAVGVLIEAKRRLNGNANAKMLVDWVRVKLERIFL